MVASIRRVVSQCRSPATVSWSNVIFACVEGGV